MPVTGSTARPEQRPRGRRCRPVLLLVALVAALLPAMSGEPAGGSEIGWLSDEDSTPVMHLSFDDGPHWLFTPMLLDLLDSYGARASFFPTGETIAARWDPETTQALLSRGHTVGNHTWVHSDLSTLSADSALAEVARASVGLEALTGFKPSCFRAPYGEVGQIRARLGPDLGMSLAGWTADPQEWRDPPIQEVLSYLQSRERDGMVVLLHDRKWLTLHIVERILAIYSSRGWTFEVLPGCHATGARDSRVATLESGDPPVGRIEAFGERDGSTWLEGWAFDADLPGGGLPLRVTVSGQEPVIVGRTAEDHHFSFPVSLASAHVSGLVCVWAVDAGQQGHDPSLGCRRLPAG